MPNVQDSTNFTGSSNLIFRSEVLTLASLYGSAGLLPVSVFQYELLKGMLKEKWTLGP